MRFTFTLQSLRPDDTEWKKYSPILLSGHDVVIDVPDDQGYYLDKSTLTPKGVAYCGRMMLQALNAENEQYREHQLALSRGDYNA